MAGNAQRYEPKATVDISVPGVSASSVSGVSVTLRVGSWASGSISFHPKDAEGRATKVFSADVSKVLGQIQKQGFADRTEADATVTLSDGRGGTLVFPGMTTSPSYRMMPGNLDRTVELVHEAALIDGLKTGIYNWTGELWAENAKDIVDSTWSIFLLKIYNFLHEKGRNDWAKLTSADQELTAQAHAQNNKLKPILESILKVSAATTGSDALSKLAGNGDSVLANGIGRGMLYYLAASTEGFWATLNQICAAFQLLYIPPTTKAPYGHLIRLKDALLSAPVDKELSLLNCSFRMSTDSVLPLQQVIIRAGGQSIWAFTDKLEATPRAIVAWPKTAVRSTGQVLNTTVPSWLVPSSSLDLNKSAIPPITVGPPGNTDVLDITSYKGKNTIAARLAVVSDALMVQFLEEYAQSLYIDRCLAGSSFTATVPLDLTWEPGDRYTVLSSGDKLFTGFLAQVTHTATVEPGSGTASTRLDFTHVELGDFKLAGVN